MGVVAKRFDVFLVKLNPTIGSEIQKTRPCVIISPDKMNRYIATVMIVLMTTKGKAYSMQISC
jgi:mRNA interferase MazF